MSKPRTEPGRRLRDALESIGVRDPERGMIVDAEAAAYALGVVHGRDAARVAAPSDVPLKVCPACGDDASHDWWPVGDDSYSCDRAARAAAPSDGTVDGASLVTFVLRPGFADGRPSGPRTERGHALASSLRRRLPDVDIDYDEWVREIEVDAVTLALGPTPVAAPSDGRCNCYPVDPATPHRPWCEATPEMRQWRAAPSEPRSGNYVPSDLTDILRRVAAPSDGLREAIARLRTEPGARTDFGDAPPSDGLREAVESITRTTQRPAGRGPYVEHEVDEGHAPGEPCRFCDALAATEQPETDEVWGQNPNTGNHGRRR
jgi:hypothetical protein